MNLQSGSNLKTYQILSIGNRGVGKTVFLAGCYTKLQQTLRGKQMYYLSCQDVQAQRKIEQVVDYISQHRGYPPPTMKVDTFNFTVRRRNKMLCHINWIDPPGEECDIYKKSSFQRFVLSSHGCCAFFDAEALLHEENFEIEETINQVVAIASVAHKNGVNYPICLVITKCDSFQVGPLSQIRIDQSLQALVSRLDGVKANYRYFYSGIPIVSDQIGSFLSPSNAVEPLLWITSELRKINKLSLQKGLGSAVMENSHKMLNKLSMTKNLDISSFPVVYKYLPITLAIFCFMGIIATLCLLSSPLGINSKQAWFKGLNTLPSKLINENR